MKNIKIVVLGALFCLLCNQIVMPVRCKNFFKCCLFYCFVKSKKEKNDLGKPLHEQRSFFLNEYELQVLPQSSNVGFVQEGVEVVPVVDQSEINLSPKSVATTLTYDSTIEEIKNSSNFRSASPEQQLTPRHAIQPGSGNATSSDEWEELDLRK
jgi:hypothetical protein